MEEVECSRGFRTSSSSWLELGASGMVCGAYLLSLFHSSPASAHQSLGQEQREDGVGEI